MELASKHCVPCEGGVPKLSPDEAAALGRDVPDWRVEGERITRTLKFKDFRALMAFVNRVADVAEAEGHHPDFCVHYNRLDITIWTHAVGGLTENDFILAAKLDQLTAK